MAKAGLKFKLMCVPSIPAALSYLFILKILCFDYTLHLTLFCITFRCTAQQLDIHIGYKVSPIIQVPM